MLCDDCNKRTACMHITKIVNNQKTERNLCAECAKAAGEISLAFDTQFYVHDFLKGMFNHGLFADPKIVEGQAHCPECKMTYDDFNRKGKVGCGACYTVFGEQFDPLLKRIHGASSHTGKFPKRSGSTLKIRQQIKNLRQQLEQYVLNEEYEKAVILRDDIKKLEKEIGLKGKEE
ncbi:UvrB/UvrC motif-containing protein [Pelosinus sp. UFO1]|uniref:UvrB/UvrC motif-containing protein n=1 Tax=Pelosinus sp. UFO1 TaxID=484770 RepID=UPI0004D16560|nr:UvrB/UvrC motif-containing protein [Pelosinus sp. UFO1]AIF50084.1 UvrB/UvrC protein [Pelosinus sp. UFO1]